MSCSNDIRRVLVGNVNVGNLHLQAENEGFDVIPYSPTYDANANQWSVLMDTGGGDVVVTLPDPTTFPFEFAYNRLHITNGGDLTGQTANVGRIFVDPPVGTKFVNGLERITIAEFDDFLFSATRLSGAIAVWNTVDDVKMCVKLEDPGPYVGNALPVDMALSVTENDNTQLYTAVTNGISVKKSERYNMRAQVTADWTGTVSNDAYSVKIKIVKRDGGGDTVVAEGIGTGSKRGTVTVAIAEIGQRLVSAMIDDEFYVQVELDATDAPNIVVTDARLEACIET